MKKVVLIIIVLFLQSCLIRSQDCTNLKVNNEKQYFIYDFKNGNWEDLNKNNSTYWKKLSIKYLENSFLLVEENVFLPSGDGSVNNNFCIIDGEIKKQEYINSYISLGIIVRLFIKNEVVESINIEDLQTGKPAKIFYKNHKDEIPKNEILKRFKENKPLYFWSEGAFAYGDIPPFMKDYEKYRKEILEILKDLKKLRIE